MKRPQPDLNVTSVNTFVAAAGSCRKLKRLWGTTTVDVEGQAVEVFNDRRHYYVDKLDIAEETENKKLFKFLNVYNDIKDYDGKGLKSAWFLLNKSKGPEETAADESYFRENLNTMWWDTDDGAMPEGLTLTTSIVIGGKFDNSGGITGIDFSLSKAAIAQNIIDNYESLWATNRITQEGVGIINKGSVHDSELNIDIPDEDDLSPDDPWLSIISRYALRDSGIPCTIKDVEVGIGGSVVTTRQGKRNTVYNTAVVTLEIPYHEFLVDDPLVVRVLADNVDTEFKKTNTDLRKSLLSILGKGYETKNEHVTQSSAKQVNFYETAEDIDASVVSRNYLSFENHTQGGEYSTYWVTSGGLWYLKADVINNPKAYNTTYVKLSRYLFSLLDTGYKKKKVPKWKKVVAVVVFVVAVVVTYLYPPAASLTSPIMKAAAAVLIGSLIVSIVTAVFGALGMYEWSSAFAWVSKEIEPLVAVASIIMVLDLISTTADLIAKQGAIAIVDLVSSSVLGTSVSSIMAGSLTTMQVVSVTNKALAAYTNVQAGKLENLSDRNKDDEAENEKLKEEMAMDADMMMKFMTIYPKPATADWSIYASTYDRPYERSFATQRTSNIQVTSFQAIRKANYDDPMFDNINFA